MPLGASIQVSASGLTAERLRLDVISDNIANANTTRGVNGQPFRRREVVFAARGANTSDFASRLASARTGSVQSAGNGVQVTEVREDTTHDFKVVYDPGHPDADKQGFVKMPNVNPIMEMVDMMSATRSYEGGIAAINAAKQMQARALDIGR